MFGEEIVFAGDFNARVGVSQTGELYQFDRSVGRYGLPEINENGEMLRIFVTIMGSLLQTHSLSMRNMVLGDTGAISP